MSKVVVFLADGFEEIEGLTVVDLLRRAGVEVLMAAVMKGKEIKGAHGIGILADVLAEEVDFSAGYDCIAGGMPNFEFRKM